MAMIAMLSGKAAPGVTTSVALLASVWPGPVVAVDADPAGGDITMGWLAAAENRAPLGNRGVVSFAIASEHLGTGTARMLTPHLLSVDQTRNCFVLAGLARPTDARFVGPSGWSRLAQALAGLSKPGNGVDVLVDCGRFGAQTPLPLLSAADLVLIVARPQRRYVVAAQHLAVQLRSMIAPERLGLALCATTPERATEAQGFIGLHSAMELPDDLRVARVYSDGTRPPAGIGRSRLVRTAAGAATRLNLVLNDEDSRTVVPMAVSLKDLRIPVPVRDERASLAANSGSTEQMEWRR